MGLKIVNTKFLADSTIVNPDIFSGVICLESAARVQGLCLYPTTPLKIFCDTFEAYMGYLTFVRPLRSTDGETIHIGKNLYVTNRERTICDLVAYNGNEEYIYQALQMYLAKWGTEKDLMCHAENYGCVDRMRSRIDTLRDYWDEMSY